MIIGGCIASLFVLAIILITITTSAAGGGSVSASAGSPTVSHNWYYKPTKDHSQPVVADDAPFIDNYNTIYMGDPTLTSSISRSIWDMKTAIRKRFWTH